MSALSHDVLIIGSGAAGMTAALHLADRYRVAVLSKGRLQSGSTWWAQGGIATVFDPADSFESHIQDTLVAGAGLWHEDAVRFTVENGPAAIHWLIEQGVTFTRDESTGDYHLTQEGGHSCRRILHTADATGREVSGSLSDRVLAHPNITVFENHVLLDLITQRSEEHTSELQSRGHLVCRLLLEK